MTIEENFVFPVYIYKNVLEEIKKVCKKAKLEVFGYLSGMIYKWNDKNYIVIEEQLFLIGAIKT